jgi:hypothetical protein
MRLGTWASGRGRARPRAPPWTHTRQVAEQASGARVQGLGNHAATYLPTGEALIATWRVSSVRTAPDLTAPMRELRIGLADTLLVHACTPYNTPYNSAPHKRL